MSYIHYIFCTNTWDRSREKSRGRDEEEEGRERGENLEQGAQRATYYSPEYNVSPSLTDRTGRPSCFPIGPKNTNLVEDILRYCFLSRFVEFIQWFQRRRQKCLS